MKCRFGFVSNSSSASFVIHLSSISAYQLQLIQMHIKVGKRLGMAYAEDKNTWSIYVNEEEYQVEGNVSMDNFSMTEFLEKIGVLEQTIEWRQS